MTWIELKSLLAEQSIHVIEPSDLSETERTWLDRQFMSQYLPILTPIGLDPSHPFPKLLNKSLNFIIELEGADAFGRESGIAIVQD